MYILLPPVALLKEPVLEALVGLPGEDGVDEDGLELTAGSFRA